MDIDVVITKATTLLQQAQNYKALLAQKSDIQTQTQGVITINGESKSIEIDSTERTSSRAMDTLCDEIIAELLN